MRRFPRNGQREVPLFDVLKSGYDALLSCDYKKVAKVLDTVLLQHPHEPNALLLAAMFGAERGKRTLPNGEPIDGLSLAEEWAARAIDKADAPWPLAWNFKATLYFKLGRLTDSLAAADHAIELGGGTYHEPYVNRGNTLMALGRFEEAKESYRLAGTVKPNHPSHRFNRSFIKLVQGDWLDGFSDYEARWHMVEWNRDHGRPIHKDLPRWWGEALGGKRLFLHWEQGYGDSIMMLRYLPWVRSQGPGHITLEVQRALIPLVVERLDPTDLTVLGPGDAAPPCDLWCPLFGLPAIHRTTHENVPDGRWLRRVA